MSQQEDQPQGPVSRMERAAEELARKLAATEQAKAELSRLSTASRRHRAWIVAEALGLFLVIALSVGLIVTGVNLSKVQTQQRQTEKMLTDLQTVQRAKVLCPLYQLLLASDTPQARAATPPAQRPAREQAFQVIRDGYQALGCPLVNGTGGGNPGGNLVRAAPPT